MNRIMNSGSLGFRITMSLFVCVCAVGTSAQRINLNFTTGTDYAGSEETSPATPSGPAGSWNNISLTAANADVPVVYSDGGAGPVLEMDTGRSGNWTQGITVETADYTGSGAVYDVANLYESGLRNGDNSTLGYRLRGLPPDIYAVHLVPIYRGYDAAGSTYQAGTHLLIGTGNTTDARDSGDYTLATTAADPDQYIDTSLTGWVAATDGATPYNYVTAIVTIDSTNRWLTFLFEDGGDPDRPGPAVIQIEPTTAPPAHVPVITGIHVESDEVILGGTNGPASAAYQVFSCTNMSLPMTNWSTLGTYPFDASGKFNFTNPTSPGASQEFFRLTVGGTLPPPPSAPSITNQPQSLTVAAGEDASFAVGVSGSEPLDYAWYFDADIPLGVNSNQLALTSVDANDEGDYFVIVSNSLGSATSLVATLSVLTTPEITAQPQDAVVAENGNAAFSVTAVGAAPLAYQWLFNTNTPVGGDTNTLSFVNVQTNDAGFYSVVVSNDYGAVTSSVASLIIAAPVTNNARFNLVGFGEGVTGGGIIPETDPAYRKVYTDLEFATAVRDANKTAGSVKVIEIMNDLDLGYHEINPDIMALYSTPFSEPATPLIHPVLLQTGVSTVQISPKEGLTIFSANGATIRHASWSIKDTENIIIRNLKFDELWEWDEASKGDYDRNNWDNIVIGVGGGTVNHVWIDHCTFTKAYDGTIDTKGGAGFITYSWNKYMGDDGATNPDSFVWKQINALESNRTDHAMYNFLRAHGYSPADIVTIIQGPDKTHAIGELSLHSDNINSCVTFHHQWYINCWDRLPRLAGGAVHNFNIFVDDRLGLEARRLRGSIADAMSESDRHTLNDTYNFKPFLNGSISTENGSMLIEKSVYIDCVWPLRNNQTDPSNPVYTGRIKATDTIYSFLESNGSTTYVRGDSTDPGNPLGPFQASIIPFQWNTDSPGTPDGVLPYGYSMDDPGELEDIVTHPTEGAGAGVLHWDKTNWLRTTY